jgi:hypothetical protein
MTKLTGFSPPLRNMATLGPFYPKKNSFVHTDGSPLSILWSPINKNWLQKKSPEIW